MRTLVVAALALATLVTASPAFAALDAYTNSKGEVVQAELKGGKLLDAKGVALPDGKYVIEKGGKSQRVTVTKGNAMSDDWTLNTPAMTKPKATAP